jgi:predicted transcriptional regulator
MISLNEPALMQQLVFLLKYLQKNEKATLKELCQALNISRWRAQRILVALVSAGIIRNHTTEKMEFFTLS